MGGGDGRWWWWWSSSTLKNGDDVVRDVCLLCGLVEKNIVFAKDSSTLTNRLAGEIGQITSKLY